MNELRIIKKFVRLPWEVYKGSEHFKDKEVASSVAFDCGALEFFKECPDEDDFQMILHSIAIPIIIASIRSKHEILKERCKWKHLDVADKDALLSQLNLCPRSHDSVLQIPLGREWLYRLPSYIAAAFALTTYLKPYVITYDKFVQAAFNSLSGDTMEMAEMRRAGLLILVGAGGPIAGADKVYGFLASMLNRRQRYGNIHVFVDNPEGSVLENMMNETQVFRKDIVRMYMDIFPPALRMQSLLCGPNTYMYPIDMMESARNERRQTVVI